MRIVLAILCNAALLAVLLPWLWRQWRWAVANGWRVVFGVSLALRILVGVLRSWKPQLDAKYMSYMSELITARLSNNSSEAWHILTSAITIFPSKISPVVYQNTSNTWVLIKLLAVLNFSSFELEWLNGLYLSVFAFIGCWQLSRSLAELFPATPAGAGAVAFLLWPSTLFWATGISKEAVLLGSGAWLTARVLERVYSNPGKNESQPNGFQLGWWINTVLLIVLHLSMRYFFAVPLFGILCAVILGRWLEHHGLARQRWAQMVIIAAVLGAGAWLAPQIDLAFRVNKFTNQVIRIYSFEVEHSIGRPHFEYDDLRPTVESIAAHAPQAAVNVLTRPWLGESWQPLYLAASLENAALLALLALAVVAALRGRAGHLPFGLGLGLGVFCLILAVLMGLTTPNLGSLNRYRSELLPFLLLLLLQNDYAAAALRRFRLGSRRSA